MRSARTERTSLRLAGRINSAGPIDALVRRVFGASSEQLDRSQLELLLQLSASATPAEPTAVIPTKNKVKVQPRKVRAPRLPEHLPVVEEVIEPELVKQAPADWRCIGQEVSEQLDYEPARFLRRRTIRKKYVHRTEVDAVPVIAPLPERLAGIRFANEQPVFLAEGRGANGVFHQIIVNLHPAVPR